MGYGNNVPHLAMWTLRQGGRNNFLCFSHNTDSTIIPYYADILNMKKFLILSYNILQIYYYIELILSLHLKKFKYESFFLIKTLMRRYCGHAAQNKNAKYLIIKYLAFYKSTQTRI